VAFDEDELVKILDQPTAEQPAGIAHHDSGLCADDVRAIGLEKYVLERWLVGEPIEILR
jgi:hypothetical protein